MIEVCFSKDMLKPSEKATLLEKLSPENGTCIGCPVFATCGQYATCEDALKNGIQWIMETKVAV